jgi:hypothetical protein
MGYGNWRAPGILVYPVIGWYGVVWGGMRGDDTREIRHTDRGQMGFDRETVETGRFRKTEAGGPRGEP